MKLKTAKDENAQLWVKKYQQLLENMYEVDISNVAGPGPVIHHSHKQAGGRGAIIPAWGEGGFISTTVLVTFVQAIFVLKWRRPQKWRQPQKKDDLKNEDNLKNKDNIKNEDDLKNEDNLKNEDASKNEDDRKN